MKLKAWEITWSRKLGFGKQVFGKLEFREMTRGIRKLTSRNDIFKENDTQGIVL